MVDRGTVDFLLSYEGELRGMTRPDKGVINSLTMLAADNQDNYNISFGIVQTVEQCVRTAPPHLKLVPLYLMDSIVKNVGGMYTRMFVQNLTEVFSGAFSIVDNKMRESFIKLLDTWRTQSVFPAEKNDEIRVRLTQVLTGGAPTQAQQPPMSDPMQSLGRTDDHRAIQNRVMNILGNIHQTQQTFHQPVPEPRMDWQQQMQQQLQYGQQGGPPQHGGASNYHSRYTEQQQFSQVEQMHGGHAAWSTSQPHPASTHSDVQLGGHMQGSVQANPFSLLLEGVNPQDAQGGSPDLARVTGALTNGEVPLPQNTSAPSPSSTEPRTLKVSDLESRDVSDVIKSLYDEYPHQCKSDGRRFKSKDVLERHLDRIFVINKARKDCTGVKERHWFSKAGDWRLHADKDGQHEKTGTKDGGISLMDCDTTSDGKIVASTVHADQFDLGIRCAACNEQLKRVYDNDDDVWVFRGCVRVGKDGMQDPNGHLVVHLECFQPGACLSPIAATGLVGQW